jgi:hypothetical protein
MDLREQQDYGRRGKALGNDGVLSQVAGRLGVMFMVCNLRADRSSSSKGVCICLP